MSEDDEPRADAPEDEPADPHAADTGKAFARMLRGVEEAERALAREQEQARQDREEARRLRRLQLEALEREAQPPQRLPGRPEGAVPTSEETFFKILELVVKEDASGRRIERETDTDRELSFVNRNKAGRLRKWVERNPAAAKKALDRHEIPRIFRDTGGGVIFPKL